VTQFPPPALSCQAPTGLLLLPPILLSVSAFTFSSTARRELYSNTSSFDKEKRCFQYAGLRRHALKLLIIPLDAEAHRSRKIKTAASLKGIECLNIRALMTSMYSLLSFSSRVSCYEIAWCVAKDAHDLTPFSYPNFCCGLNNSPPSAFAACV
jgi:hypothetical protein